MVGKIEWKNETRRVSDLIPWDKNPRQITEKQLAELKKSISKFNFTNPVIIDTENRIICGHMRLRAMASLGRGSEIVPVRIPSRKLTEKEFEELAVRDNLNTGEWDIDALANGFDIDDLIDWGFDELVFGLPEQKDDNIDENSLEDEPVVSPISEVGCKWILGRHVLVCGDSRTADFSCVSEKKIVFTDPPYELESNIVSEIIDRCGANHCICIMTMRQIVDILAMKKYKFHFDFVLNAHIPKSFMNRRQPYYLHQNGIYISLDDKSVFNNDFSKGRRSDDSSNTGYWSTIIDAPRRTNSGHGHSKSIRGMNDVLAGFDFDSIIDPFAGSGTSLFCAEHYKVPWVGCELKPEFCDLIIINWQKLTGQDAVNSASGKTYNELIQLRGGLS